MKINIVGSEFSGKRESRADPGFHKVAPGRGPSKGWVLVLSSFVIIHPFRYSLGTGH